MHGERVLVQGVVAARIIIAYPVESLQLYNCSNNAGQRMKRSSDFS